VPLIGIYPKPLTYIVSPDEELLLWLLLSDILEAELGELLEEELLEE
jgi:hypothetical protein